MNEQSKLTNPGVRFPPPFLFVLGLGTAWLLETRVARLPFLGRAADIPEIEVLAGALIFGGLAIMVWGMITFARAKTAILPIMPASRIVDHGPYRFTRNPMYTGMSIAYIGGAIVLDSGWALIFFPLVIMLLQRFVIQKEERYLMNAFGEDYAAYQRRVGRWM